MALCPRYYGTFIFVLLLPRLFNTIIQILSYIEYLIL